MTWNFAQKSWSAAKTGLIHALRSVTTAITMLISQMESTQKATETIDPTPATSAPPPTSKPPTTTTPTDPQILRLKVVKLPGLGITLLIFPNSDRPALTDTQAQTLAFLQTQPQFSSEEIRQQLSLKSLLPLDSRIEHLEQKGYLKRVNTPTPLDLN